VCLCSIVVLYNIKKEAKMEIKEGITTKAAPVVTVRATPVVTVATPLPVVIAPVLVDSPGLTAESYPLIPPQ